MQINSYNSKIIIESNLSASLEPVFSKFQAEKIFVIVDSNTYEFCFPQLKEIIQQKNTFVLTIGQGEENKNFDTVRKIWDFLQANKCERNSLIINLGGGLLLDIGGFAAATYQRGVKFIHIPTTLLSMVDASIGGKLGFNFNGIKNQIGLFQTPEFVIINPSFLKTLNKRQIYAGWAEMLKHGLIHSQEHLDHIIKQNPLELGDVKWKKLIYNSLQIKNHFVINDPHEKGMRKALNFGHTIGHAFESLSFEKKEPLLHGEAVANGMICELFLSSRLLNFPIKKAEKIIDSILKTYRQIKIDKQDVNKLEQIMIFDKKNKDNAVNFSLLKDVGSLALDQYATEEEIRGSLFYYKGKFESKGQI